MKIKDFNRSISLRTARDEESIGNLRQNLVNLNEMKFFEEAEEA